MTLSFLTETDLSPERNCLANAASGHRAIAPLPTKTDTV